MREEEGTLTLDESNTLKAFLVEEEAVAPTAGAPKKRLQDLIAEKKAARMRGGTSKSRYHPAVKRTVLGSAAEVERLWSMAGYVLTKDRAKMSPLVFECIMYLQYNKDLWSLEDVVKANKRRKNEARVERETRSRVNNASAEIATWETALV